MKARISTKHYFSKEARQKMDEYVQEKKKAEFDRLLKLVCVWLNQEPDFKFSKNKLKRMVYGVAEMLEQENNKEIMWDKIDELLIEKLKLPFEREDYEERELAVKQVARERH